MKYRILEVFMSNLKKFLLIMFSFLFISTASIGSGLIFAGCNQTHSEQAGGDLTNRKTKMMKV